MSWDGAIVVSAGKTEETVGYHEWTAQFSVWKTTGKDSSEACAIVCQNWAVYSVFPSGMTSHSKIAQFNWGCIGRLTRSKGEPLILYFIKCITRQQRPVWKRRILYLTHKAVWFYSISIKHAVCNQYSGEREWAIKHMVVARFGVKLFGILKTRSGPEFGDWPIRRIANS